MLYIHQKALNNFQVMFCDNLKFEAQKRVFPG